MEEGGGLRNESWSTSTLRSVKGDQEGVASEIGGKPREYGILKAK